MTDPLHLADSIDPRKLVSNFKRTEVAGVSVNVDAAIAASDALRSFAWRGIGEVRCRRCGGQGCMQGGVIYEAGGGVMDVVETEECTDCGGSGKLYRTTKSSEPFIVWVKINGIETLPKKPGKSSYEHVDCLILYHGAVLPRMWNCEHGVWDGEDGDDFFCGPLDPSHYAIITRPLP